ncbi:unnamed protein product [Soboliphyme baturini]|uniref:Phorbol-ester/DAG-type domain-containing protein n=1 Tax=Soboliphyme baturini TaxID=241478 RepID=A0A183ICA9_9BILA|nr:unnamed protein product [Soboliphyme baturini]
MFSYRRYFFRKLYHVRHVTLADARFAQEKEIPRIFQIIYAGEGESRKNEESHVVTEPAKSDAIQHKGHDFILILFHSPTSCDICSKQLWNVLKPPAALECKRCHIKIHRDHLEKHDKDVAPCRVNYDPMLARDMLIMVSSAEESKQWVSFLHKRIEQLKSKADKSSISSSSSHR